MNRQCVILAGGFGTRLGAATKSVPKPILRVGDRPFLSHVVENLRLQGIDRITILAGYLGEQIVSLFADSSDVDVLIETEPLGTGGALRFAEDQGALEDEFFLLNGDTLFDVSLAQLAYHAAHCRENWLGWVALRRLKNTSRSGVVEHDGHRITKFNARPSSDGQVGVINGGVYLLKRKIVDIIPPEKVSLEEAIFPLLVETGKLHGTIFDAPFIDIGVPEDLEKSQTFVPKLLTRPALFLDRDGVICEDTGHPHKISEFIWVDGAKDAICRATELGYNVFIVTNQGGVARGLYDEMTVQELHNWVAEEIWKAGGYISDFRYCPHNPDGTDPSYAKPCNWRKPAPGMLIDLLSTYRIDKANSLMVGDRETDMKAAKAAGISGHRFEGGNLASFIEPYLTATWRQA